MSQQTWNLNNYDGDGVPNYDEDGKIVSITMTEEQERQHDKEYRQRLIAAGIIVPKEKVQMRYLSIILPLLLVGCTLPNHRKLAIDTNFTEEEVSVIEQAIEDWTVAIDHSDAIIYTQDHIILNEFTIDEWDAEHDEHGIIYKIYTTDIGYKALVARRGKDFTGIARTGAKMAIVMDRVRSDREFDHIVKHEMGHFYGVAHQASGLMGTDEKIMYNCVDWVALNAYCEDNDCGEDNFTSCEGQYY